MPINNFEILEQNNFFKFEPGTFYKFECLVRNTDGENVLYEHGYSNTNKNILVKNWYIDTQEYYDRIKNQMIKMCDLTGGRLYVCTDKKSNLKLLQTLSQDMVNLLCEATLGQVVGIKRLSKIMASKTSVKETSIRDDRMIMFDVDTKDEKIYNAVLNYIKNNNQKPIVLPTKKGYHILCHKRFQFNTWQQYILKDLGLNEQDVEDLIFVKDNQLCLVYHPNASL